jgi:hypothetical protein
MTDRELMQQALDALEYSADQTKPEDLRGCDCLICTTILALRNRLAQKETPEVTPDVTPYLVDCPRCGHCCPQPNQESVKDKRDFWALFDETQRLRAELKFNTTPPQRWVGLTDEEIKEIVHTYPRPMGPINFARAVEQRLKEMNA